MKVGLYIRLFGRPGSQPPPPSWSSIRDEALAAEAAGFDLVVLEDGSLYPGDGANDGLWEAVSTAAAIAASTSTIGVGHAVINSPYRYPALVARAAATLDEISGGRYTLGIGAGNTPDDYGPFGIDADRRYSRFAEAIQIIHGLLRDGRVAFDGEFYRAPGAELILTGPRPGMIPIVIAAGSPKMLRLAARFGDEWNWWVAERDPVEGLREIVDEVERACEEVDRDPASLRRSIDVFSVATPGVRDLPPDSTALRLGGSTDEVAAGLLDFRTLGFDEVRIDLKAADGAPQTDAIARMEDVVSLVHAA